MSDTIVANLNEDILGEIHNALSTELLERIRSGEASPTDLNVARQLLKDNNITINPAAASPLLNIAEELPYNDDLPNYDGQKQANKVIRIEPPSNTKMEEEKLGVPSVGLNAV